MYGVLIYFYITVCEVVSFFKQFVKAFFEISIFMRINIYDK